MIYACALFGLVLLAVAVFALERALRPVDPVGVPTYQGPTTACQRCGRDNLAADLYGRPLPHYAHTRAEHLCGRRGR